MDLVWFGEVLKFQPSCCQPSLKVSVKVVIVLALQLPCPALSSPSFPLRTLRNSLYLLPMPYHNIIENQIRPPETRTIYESHAWYTLEDGYWMLLESFDHMDIFVFFSVWFLLGLFPQRCFHTRARLARGDTVSECQAGKPWWSEGPQEDR